MKKARFTESQIISILSKQEKGVLVADICHAHSISNATFFNWKGKELPPPEPSLQCSIN